LRIGTIIGKEPCTSEVEEDSIASLAIAKRYNVMTTKTMRPAKARVRSCFGCGPTYQGLKDMQYIKL
jgi:hypothetical protein